MKLQRFFIFIPNPGKNDPLWRAWFNHQLVKGEVETCLVYELYNLGMAISPRGPSCIGENARTLACQFAAMAPRSSGSGGEWWSDVSIDSTCSFEICEGDCKSHQAKTTISLGIIVITCVWKPVVFSGAGKGTDTVGPESLVFKSF